MRAGAITESCGAPGCLSKFDNADTVFAKQSRGNSKHRRQAAGRAFCLEHGQSDVLSPGNFEYGLGSGNILSAHVDAVPVNDQCASLKNIHAVTTGQVGSSTGSGQAAELFRADREIMEILQSLQASRIRFAATVIAGTEADKATTDQTVTGFAVHGFGC